MTGRVQVASSSLVSAWDPLLVCAVVVLVQAELSAPSSKVPPFNFSWITAPPPPSPASLPFVLLSAPAFLLLSPIYILLYPLLWSLTSTGGWLRLLERGIPMPAGGSLVVTAKRVLADQVVM